MDIVKTYGKIGDSIDKKRLFLNKIEDIKKELGAGIVLFSFISTKKIEVVKDYIIELQFKQSKTFNVSLLSI